MSNSKYTNIDSFTVPLGVAMGMLVYWLYSDAILPSVIGALSGLIKVDELKLYQNSRMLGEKYKFLTLLIFYIFYFLFLVTRKQKSKKTNNKYNKYLVISFIVGLMGYSLFCFYIFPINVLSILHPNIISISTTIAIIAVLPFVSLIATSLKNHTLQTEKNLVFDFDRNKKSRPDNLIFSLYTKDGWVNYPNIFQGFFGSGGAGSGKSVSLIEPFMWQMAEKNMCGLIFDFKNWELTSQMIAYLSYHRKHLKEQQAHWDNSFYATLPKFLQGIRPRPRTVIEEDLEVRVVDFMNPKSSHRVNFLQPRIIDSLIKVDSVIKKFLKALSPADAEKKDIWFNGSVALFKGGLLFFKKHFPEYCTFPHILVFLTMIDTETIKSLFDTDDDVKMVSDVYMKAPEKTAGSIAASLSSSLSQLVDPNIFWVLSGDDIDFALNSKENPTLLFLVTDEEFAQSLNPLASIIAITCLNAMNKKGRYPSLAMFDEFPQIFLDDIDRLPATCRSNKVGIMCVIQDLSQLLKEYGDKMTKALCANLLNKIYFKATDKDTQEEMSNLMGEIEVVQESQSRGDNSDSSSFSIVKKKYVATEDILNFQEGEGLGVKSTGKKERRYHSNFKTLFRLYDGKSRHIKGTGYPKMPEIKDVLLKKGAIEFNIDATQDAVNRNYAKIKEDVQNIVKAKLKQINTEEEEVSENLSTHLSAEDMPIN